MLMGLQFKTNARTLLDGRRRRLECKTIINCKKVYVSSAQRVRYGIQALVFSQYSQLMTDGDGWYINDICETLYVKGDRIRQRSVLLTDVFRETFREVWDITSWVHKFAFVGVVLLILTLFLFVRK